MLTRETSIQPEVSVEYFPAKGLSSERALLTGAHALRRFDPDYQTVTFGAGGSAIEGSLEWSSQLQAFTNIPTASHIAICHFSKATLIEFAEELLERGITRLVVLRGDAADDGGEPVFESVADAITLLLGVHPFEISVAAYPEVHPRAQSAQSDIEVLLEKQQAGATRAITQYFFNNEDFYKFRERAQAAGVTIPIVPGIMPIANFEKIKEFSTNCGAAVPAEFEDLFAAAGPDKSEQTDVARKIVEKQVKDLANNDVAAIHIYSLNRVDLTADTIRAFKTEFSADSAPQHLRAVG